MAVDTSKLQRVDLSENIAFNDGVSVKYINIKTGVLSNTPVIKLPLEIKEVAEVLEGVETQIIELRLVSDNKQVNPVAGFLVEVYLSGTDGKLTRLFRDDRINFEGSIVSEGFSNFIDLKVDVDD